MMVKGRIHSFESFGTVDGPGIRFVIFTQGCPLRCKYCHNPDTWAYKEGTLYEVDEVIDRIMKYKSYFKNGGGVTVSGGEPLVQIDFVIELFKKLKAKGLHTCVDTSGILFNQRNENIVAKYDELLKYTDLFLLDIKQIDSDDHKKLTGLRNETVLNFARYLSDKQHPMWIRHVLVPGWTSAKENLIKIREFIETLDSVQKIEILPYHTMGSVKYEKMGIDYVFKDMRVPTKEEIEMAEDILIRGNKNV